MPVPLKAGEVLRGRYKIRRIIGQGGMGSIYLADDLRLEGRLCALKEVEHDRTLPADLREAREQFQREAVVLARLDHPNLPKVSDFFSIGKPRLPGDGLRAGQRPAHADDRSPACQPIPGRSDVLNWSSQLADALSFMHSQDPPILHRDIKPSNLKLTPNGT
jgi:eukaryotic-like serine/threonine-protein kinase